MTRIGALRQGFLAMLLALCPSLVLAQGGPTQQSGQVTPGHPSMWITNGVIGDAGSALSGRLKELGITNTGTPFCINDAPITGPYHQLCLGANANGAGVISYNAYGGAAPQGLSCILNGTTVANCFQGLGNVTGAPSSKPGQVALFNNVAGTQLINGATASSLANWVPDASPFQQYNPDIYAASLLMVEGSTAAPEMGINVPVIIQRIGSVDGAQHAQLAPALLVSAISGNIPPQNGSHAWAFVAQTNDTLGWNGVGVQAFNQGATLTCNLLGPGANGSCNGGNGESNAWVPYHYLFGLEGDDNNNTGVDSPFPYNPQKIDGAFLAACADHGVIPGTAKCGGGYIVNPFNAISFHWGFFIPPSHLNTDPDISSFETQSQDGQYGLDMGLAKFSVVAIRMPNANNGGGIWSRDSTGANNVNTLFIGPGNELSLGDDAAISTVFLGPSSNSGATNTEINSTFIKLPFVNAGATPVASLCLDSSGQIVKKITPGPCI